VLESLGKQKGMLGIRGGAKRFEESFRLAMRNK
jgi:hypothetical protein